ncbi:hypothetical protein BX666DRAFT_798328 [Dichotomocladium elegans]|nr:hypothetical protein BX666DRAFT_798328 [Dichotomocladium elegans]
MEEATIIIQNVAYALPNDKRENDRVHLQHWLMKETFGGNFSVPVAEMLDQGTIVQDFRLRPRHLGSRNGNRFSTIHIHWYRCVCQIPRSYQA